MKLADIRIPLEEERKGWYRFFEMLPFILSMSVLLVPAILSIYDPLLAAYLLVGYIFIWFFKAIAMSWRVLQGYSRVRSARTLDWEQLLEDLKTPGKMIEKYRRSENKTLHIHAHNLEHVAKRATDDPKHEDIIHAVIIATYNESQDVIHPTIEAVIASRVDNLHNVAFFLAYEKRTGEEKERQSYETVDLYRDQFMYAEAVGHELQPNEIKGKGGNVTMAGRRVAEWAEKNGIDPSRILVTTLDADNRPDVNYFAALTYSYIVADNRKKRSYQPAAVYINNVWDAAAVMRLSAFNNSFFHIGNSMRLHALRNFSAHAQSLDALLDSDFWSVRTIVEDGHQFWRMYFLYDGEHDVVPIHAPIYQDAVYAGSYRKTLVAQFKQIRRWAYGASDVAYVGTRAFFIKNEVPKLDAIFKFFRLLEGHVTWATASLLLVLAGWLPLLLNADPETSIVALQLPTVMGRINLFGLVVIFVSMYIGLGTLPPRPPHYKRTKYVSFILSWLLIPIVGIVFNSFASIYSQWRLFRGKYFGDFDVTEKAVKSS